MECFFPGLLFCQLRAAQHTPKVAVKMASFSDLVILLSSILDHVSYTLDRLRQ